ncbi:MAG: DNA-formamidopyrimidine glycosylase family protein [Candidatus Acidiferrales bacterium]
MPEGDTIYRTARTLQLGLGGQIVTRFESAYPKLSRVDVDAPLTGRIVTKVESRGKWLLIYFSDDLILLTHMLMSGSWHIYRRGEQWQRPAGQMRIVIETAKLLAVGFLVPVAEFHTADSLARREGLKDLGPRLLDKEVDEAEIIRRLRLRPDLEVGVALMTQSLLSGIGNVYKSETCFACRVNPFRRVQSLGEAELASLVSMARKFLRANVTNTSGDIVVTYGAMRRTTGRANPKDRLWVYRRTGEPCRKCGGRIESRKQGLDARSTFWCPTCQPMALAATSRA